MNEQVCKGKKQTLITGGGGETGQRLKLTLSRFLISYMLVQLLPSPADIHLNRELVFKLPA